MASTTTQSTRIHVPQRSISSRSLLLFLLLLSQATVDNRASASSPASASSSSAVVVPSDDDDWVQPKDEDYSGDDDDNLFLPITPISSSRMVDFRDLLLPPDQAMALGGSGLQPYGDMISTNVWPFLEDITQMNDDDPYDNMVNNEVINPVTLEQSGEAGTIVLPDSLVEYTGNFTKYWSGNVYIEVSNIRAYNLNTFVPIQLAHPTTEPHLLTTKFQMGPNFTLNSYAEDPYGTVETVENEAFEFVIRLVVNITSVAPPALSNDVVDIHLQIPSAQYLADLVVLMDEWKFMMMPLEDVMNPACWVNTLWHTLPGDPDHDPIRLQLFQAVLSAFFLDITCVECSPVMGPFLPRLMKNLRSNMERFMSVMTKSMEAILQDGAYNVWDLIDLTRTIQEISTLCDHHPAYEQPTNMTQLGLPVDFDLPIYLNDNTSAPTFSRTTWETTLGLGLMTLETVMIVAAEKYLAVPDANRTAPLPPGEAGIDTTYAGDNATFLDWRTLNGTVASLRDAVNPTALNDAARGLADNTSTLVLPIPENLTVDTTLGHQFTLDYVGVQGLDTVTHLNAMEVVGPYEVATEVALSNLMVELHVSMMTTDDYQGIPMEHPEQIKVLLNFTDITMRAEAFVQVDLEQLGNLQLYTILQGPEVFIPCMLATSKPTWIQSINLTLGKMDPPKVQGYLDYDLQTMVNAVGEDLFQEFGQDIANAVPIFFETSFRKLANDLLYEQFLQLTSNTTNCVVTDTSLYQSFMDFRALLLGEGDKSYGNLFETIYDALLANVFTEDGVAQINEIVGDVTAEQSNITGALKFLEDGVDVSSSITVGNFNAQVELKVTNVTLFHLDSLGMPFYLMYPNDTYILDSQGTVGVGGRPVTLGGDVLVKAWDDRDEMDVHNDFNFSFGLDAFKLFVSILLKMSEEAFLTFPLKSTTNVYCWLALLPPATPEVLNATNTNRSGIAVADVQWNYTNITADIECYECTSPDLPQLFDQLYQQGEDDYDQIEELVTRVLDGDAVQNVLDQILKTSPSYCPHSEQYDPNVAGGTPNILDPGSPTSNVGEDGRDPNAVFFNIFFGGFGILVVVFFVVARIIIYYKNKAWTESLSSNGKRLLCKLKEREAERDAYLDQTMESLFNSTFIPVTARYGVPIMMLLDIALFIIAHVEVSIILGMDVYVAGDHFFISDIFTFNFVDGVINTYQNGGYEMAILLLIFGGIWPYMKCVITIILWFTPPTWLSADHRGRMFIWIDAMNKLTVRDIFKFLVIIAVVFIFIGGPYVWNQPGSVLYAVKVVGVPGPAIYCGIAAMIISRVSGVWVLDYHTMAMVAAQKAYHKDHVSPISYGLVDITEDVVQEEEDTDSETDDEDDDDSLVDSEVAVQGSRYIIVCRKKILLGTLGLYTGVFMVALVILVGLIFVPAVSIDLSAILELILESGTTYEQAISEFGVYAFICAVLIKARLVMESVTDYVAITIFLVIGIVVVYLMFWIGFRRWVAEVRKEGWRRVFPLFFQEDPDVVKLPEYLRLYAHRYSTAWVIAFAIGVFQLGAVTIYAINYFCRLLDTIYYPLAFIGLVPSTEGKCWEAQMGQVHNLIVFLGCFAYLVFCFIVQLTVQYRANVQHASRLLRELDAEGAFLEHCVDCLRRGKMNRVGPIHSSISETLRTRLLTTNELSELQELYDAAIHEEQEEEEELGLVKRPSRRLSSMPKEQPRKKLSQSSFGYSAPSLDGTDESPVTLDESDGVASKDASKEPVDVDDMVFDRDDDSVLVHGDEAEC